MSERTATLRILDANANRTLEGLRTMEELARFYIEDQLLSRALKTLRHDLQEQLNRLPRNELLRARDAEGDVGTANALVSQQSRKDLADVGAAAAQRVQQSMRCLEEYSKVLPLPDPPSFEPLRYRAYELFAAVFERITIDRHREFLTRAQLYLLIDCSSPIDEFTDKVARLSQAGVDLIQIRDKRKSDRELVKYAMAAADVCDPNRTRIIVNDRLDLAMASKAAGVHLGQEDLSCSVARKLLTDCAWIGVSTHGLSDILQAVSDGADYIGCGPTFPSPTKSFDAYAGIEFLKEAAEIATIPFFAIGGITLENLPAVIDSGCYRVAASSGILSSSDPFSTAAEMKLILRSAHKE